MVRHVTICACDDLSRSSSMPLALAEHPHQSTTLEAAGLGTMVLVVARIHGRGPVPRLLRRRKRSLEPPAACAAWPAARPGARTRWVSRSSRCTRHPSGSRGGLPQRRHLAVRALPRAEGAVPTSVTAHLRVRGKRTVLDFRGRHHAALWSAPRRGHCPTCWSTTKAGAGAWPAVTLR